MGVLLDAVGPSSTGTSATGTSLSWSHTVGSSSGRVLFAAVSCTRSPDSVTLSATYNSVAMTSLGKTHVNNSSAGFVELFYLLGPVSGAHTVAITASTSSTLVGGSVSYSGVLSVGSAQTNAGSGSSPFGQTTDANGLYWLVAMAAGSSITSYTGSGSHPEHVRANAGGGAAGNLGITQAQVIWPNPKASPTVNATWGLSSSSTWGVIGAHMLPAPADPTGGGSVTPGVAISTTGHVGKAGHNNPQSVGVNIAASGLVGQTVTTLSAQPQTVGVSVVAAGTAHRTHTFSPPTHEEPIRTREPWIFRFRLPQASSVIKKNGHYVLKRGVSQDELWAAGEAGVDYFVGGNLYVVSEGVAAALEADGFDVQEM